MFPTYSLCLYLLPSNSPFPITKVNIQQMQIHSFISPTRNPVVLSPLLSSKINPLEWHTAKTARITFYQVYSFSHTHLSCSDFCSCSDFTTMLDLPFEYAISAAGNLLLTFFPGEILFILMTQLSETLRKRVC